MTPNGSIPPLRLAVVSTPRSGNTWFRSLLAKFYGIAGTATHEIKDDDWERMPPEVIHQIHWPREPDFLDKLNRHGFRVVSLARHPLDTLISILHFAWYDDETACWLLGRGGDESSLRGAMPRSRCFVEYAKSERAAALLSVSADWWNQTDVVSVRYEDLVRDAGGVLLSLAERLGPPEGASVEQAVAANTIEKLRTHSLNNHFWKGRPGLWRELLPEPEAGEIAEAIAPVLHALGYEVDPDPDLTASVADRNWVRLVASELSDTVRKNTVAFRAQETHWLKEIERAHEAIRIDRAAADAEIDHFRRVADAETEVRREQERLRAEFERLADERERLRAEFERLADERERMRIEEEALHARTREEARLDRERAGAEIGRLGGELSRADRALAAAATEIEDHLRAREHLAREVEHLRNELRPFLRLERFSLRIADGVQNFRDRHPGLVRAAKRCVVEPFAKRDQGAA